MVINDFSLIKVKPTDKPNVFKLFWNREIGIITIDGSRVRAYYTNNNPQPILVYEDYLPYYFEPDGYTWKDEADRNTYYTVIKGLLTSLVHNNKETKMWYYVTSSAEEDTDGYVKLTPREADIVKYATDKSNWEGGNAQPWSGTFYIDTDHPRKSI